MKKPPKKHHKISESEPISAAVGARLEELGFVDIQRPDFGAEDLQVPTSGLSSLPSHVLGDLYTRSGAVVAYMTSMASKIELERLVAEHRYEQARAQALARLRGSADLAKTSVAEKKALADADPQVLLAHTALAQANALAKRAAMLLEAHRVTWQTLSREITRQSHDVTSTESSTGPTPTGRRNVLRN